MLRFGPGGIPLSCKGRTLKDGVEDAHYLGLTAMEAQVVRVNVITRGVKEKEIGEPFTNIPGEVVVEARRPDGDMMRILPSNEPLEDGDVLLSLATTLAKDYEELDDIRRLAIDLDIEMSVHAPYYMDLAINNDDSGILERSFFGLRCASMLAKALGAKLVTTHVGIYHGEDEDTSAIVVSNLKEFMDWMKSEKMNFYLGVETSGKQDVFGSVEEVVDLCKKVKGLSPVLNFSHIHARQSGSLLTKEDYTSLFETIHKARKDYFHTHFSGVEHSDGNEQRYTPIKKGDLKFEVLADYLLETDTSMTLISSSPLLEHDAMYMRVIYERQAIKRNAKVLKGGEETEETKATEKPEEKVETKRTKAEAKKQKKTAPKKPTKTPPKTTTTKTPPKKSSKSTKKTSKR